MFAKANGEPSVNYSCVVEYEGKDCSFFLKEYIYPAFRDCGGVDDQVKISCKVVDKLNKRLGVKVPTEVLTFEKVE